MVFLILITWSIYSPSIGRTIVRTISFEYIARWKCIWTSLTDVCLPITSSLAAVVRQLYQHWRRLKVLSNPPGFQSIQRRLYTNSIKCVNVAATSWADLQHRMNVFNFWLSIELFDLFYSDAATSAPHQPKSLTRFHKSPSLWILILKRRARAPLEYRGIQFKGKFVKVINIRNLFFLCYRLWMSKCKGMIPIFSHRRVDEIALINLRVLILLVVLCFALASLEDVIEFMNDFLSAVTLWCPLLLGYWWIKVNLYPWLEMMFKRDFRVVVGTI